MRPKSYFHRQKLTEIPADGFIEIIRDTEDSPVSEYASTSLLSQADPKLAGALDFISNAGVASVTAYQTILEANTPTNTWTVADGAFEGQEKLFSVFDIVGKTGTLSGTGFSCTFANLGEELTVKWSGTAWEFLSKSPAGPSVFSPVFTAT